jgi:hypothetical protein
MAINEKLSQSGTSRVFRSVIEPINMAVNAMITTIAVSKSTMEVLYFYLLYSLRLAKIYKLCYTSIPYV